MASAKMGRLMQVITQPSGWVKRQMRLIVG